MGTNKQEHEISDGGSELTYQEMVENEMKDPQKVLRTHKLITENCKSNSMVVKVIIIFTVLVICDILDFILYVPLKLRKWSELEPKQKRHAMIPPHIIAEAISTIRDIDIRWSGPITPKEMEYVEQYVLAKYPEYAGLIEGDGNGIDLSSFIINEEPSDDKGKSPRGTPRESSYLFGSNNLPEKDRAKIQLEPSRLLDILNKKSSFPGSFISIPEIQVRNKVLKHYGLPDEEYLVLFTPSYKDAMMLVGESYPFVKGNYYMTILGQEEDYIREFASFKESKVIPTPRTWLDLRIQGSQLSQNFRRRCKISSKGLFSYPADASGTMHWISEAHRNNWHVLLDASALVVGKDRLHLALHRPDFVVCSLDNTHSNPSRITCLLVRKKSFDTSAASSQVAE